MVINSADALRKKHIYSKLVKTYLCRSLTLQASNNCVSESFHFLLHGHSSSVTHQHFQTGKFEHLLVILSIGIRRVSRKGYQKLTTTRGNGTVLKNRTKKSVPSLACSTSTKPP